MKKKALALAVAGAFFAPASYAAQDTSGMQYTSAAEGFYASIRAQFSTEKKTDGGAGIGNSSSRFGVRGSNDLGGGLKGFYQYEAGVSSDNNGGLLTRLAHVGLEGAFGRVWAGSGWVETHNMTYGATDIGNFGGGNLSYTDLRPGRDNDVIQYRTPDISGFQGALGFNMKAGADNDSSADGNADKDDNNLEMWTAAAKYSVQGFTGAFAYSVRPDSRFDVSASSDRRHNLDGNGMRTGTPSTAVADQLHVVNAPSKKDDMTAWSARLGYAQDNWSVNGWYGKNNDSDFTHTFVANRELNQAGDMVVNSAADRVVTHTGIDDEFVSLAGGVSVDKINLYAVWDKVEYGGGVEDATTVLGVQYNLGSRSRVWMDYNGKDLDSNSNAEDKINIGLRHDF
jgi:predicted porin